MTLTPPLNFRHSIPVDIRFGDLDAFGHVNNAKYLTYVETARVRYFNELGIWDGGPSEMGLIIAKVTVDFKLPLLLQDRIVVYTRVSRLGNKSFDTECQIIREDGQVAALALITIVVYDYIANVSRVIPDSWRERLIAYEPGLRGENGAS